MNKLESGNSKNLTNRGRGRPKGAPNKTTVEMKQAIADLVQGNVHRVQEWLDLIALGDESLGVKPAPEKAFDLYLKLMEYNLPKLARTEVTGQDGGPQQIKVTWAKD